MGPIFAAGSGGWAREDVGLPGCKATAFEPTPLAALTTRIQEAFNPFLLTWLQGRGSLERAPPHLETNELQAYKKIY